MHQTQEKILNLIKEKKEIELNLYWLSKYFGNQNPQNIKHHILQLEKNNLIKIDRENNLINLVERKKSNFIISLPIIGLSSCGPALSCAIENPIGFLDVSKKSLNIKNNLENFFVIQASGDSMNKAKINNNNIEDGDYVIVDRSKNQPQNGEYVLSVYNGLSNIKRFIKNNNQIILVSESTKNYSPIYIHEDDAQDYMVNGQIIQIIKHPKNI